MKQVQLTQGFVAIIDDEDLLEISKYKWRIRNPKNSNKMYARTSIWNKITKSYKTVDMHRLLLNFPDKEIDHKNGNGLDNTRENLRLATRSQNKQNSRPIKIKNKLSKYKGVSYHIRHKKFIVSICVNGKANHLGYFLDELEAAKVYDKAAIKYFGEFADLNFKERT